MIPVNNAAKQLCFGPPRLSIVVIGDPGTTFLSKGFGFSKRKKTEPKERDPEGEACGNCRRFGNRLRWPSATFS
jgi:hypothetical protein